MKNDNINDKKSFNNYMNMKRKSSVKSNKVSQGNNIENRMNYFSSKMTLNIFN